MNYTAIARHAFPRYAGRSVFPVAVSPGIEVDPTWTGVHWKAVNLHTGRTINVRTRTHLPTDRPEVAFVLHHRPSKYQDHGIRVFLHPDHLASVLPTEATLTYPERTTLFVHTHYRKDARRRTAGILGVSPDEFRNASRRLVESGHLFPDCHPTDKGRTAIARYWDSDSLRWA
jgi:hypothetical protein